MISSRIWLFVLPSLLFSFVATAHAEEPTPTTAATKVEEPSVAAENPKNFDEDWYWGINLGAGTMRYKSEIAQANADALKNQPGVDHIMADVDLYFIWPISNYRTGIGFSLGAVVDSYKRESTDETWNVSAGIVAATIQHYFTSNIGDGFFGRFDIGVATTQEEYKTTSGQTVTDKEYNGLGLRTGLGYSFPLTRETRLPITLQWQHAATKDNTTTNAYFLTVGLLF